MKVAVTVPCPQWAREQLEKFNIDIAYDPNEAWLKQAEVIIGEPETALLPQLTALRYLQMTWAGVDRYAKMPDFPAQVTLCNMSGAFGVTIAEHAMALLLALARRLPGYVRSRAWEDLGSERAIFGQTALILGTGDLGSEIAKRCRAFGIQTIGFNRSGKPNAAFDQTTASLDAWLPRADFIFGCLPSTPQTIGLLDERRLAMLQSDAILVNVGRGNLVDCNALAKQLQAGKLWGAGLDVTDPEPLPDDHPLRSLDNVIITPHVAGVSFGHLQQTEDRIWQLCLENLQRYITNQPLQQVVKLDLGY